MRRQACGRLAGNLCGFWLAACTMLLASCLPGLVWGGSFSANPVRLFLAPGAKSVAVVIENKGDAPVLIQSELLAWGQQDGQDVLTPTRDLLVSPPIFRIAPGAAQTVRVGLMRNADPARELTYRLFLQEVPEPAPGGAQSVGVVLRLGLPIFIAPKVAAPGALVWRLHPGASPDEVKLALRNNGNVHVQVAHGRLLGADAREVFAQQLSGYVLPGQARSWTLRTSRPIRDEALKLEVRTDNGDFTHDVRVTAE